MAKETDVKIAEWMGWKWNVPPKHRRNNYMAMWDPYWSDKTGASRPFPHFSTSDEAAISLLPELVIRGFKGTLGYNCDGYDFEIIGVDWGMDAVAQPTIAAAISSAVVALIDAV